MTRLRSGAERDTRGRWTLAAVVFAIAAGLVWARLTLPRIEGGSAGGVSSADIEILVYADDEGRTFVVPTNTDGQVLAWFAVSNQGRLPITLGEVWRAGNRDDCEWQPVDRVLRDDPATMYSAEGPSREVAGATIAAGATVAIWVTLEWNAPERCVHDGLTYRDAVDVTGSVLGWWSTTRIPLGYRLGWSDDPEGQVPGATEPGRAD